MVSSRRIDGDRAASEGRRFLLPDTHAHLDAAAFDLDVADVISRAEDVGVGRILAVGSDLRSSVKALELAHTFNSVFAAVGLHPHEAYKFHDEAEQLQALLGERKVVAIGEVGLDYFRAGAPAEVQRYAFTAQLEWARRLGLPVSVHNRNAGSDTLATLAQAEVTAILHCFSSSPDFAHTAVEAGMYVSFAGNVTYPKAIALREAVKMVPADRLLVETDSPVLTPQTWRGQRNEPARVTAVLEVVAAQQGLSTADCAANITANANRVFGWSHL